MIRLFASLAALALVLSACATNDLDKPPVPLGRFLLGYNIAVVAPDVEVGPASREVDGEVWVNAVRTAINDRFSRYDGDRYFHISVAVLAYVLAKPGLPLVAAPKSVLVADVRLYDDSQGGKPITEEPKRLTVFEEGGQALIGSGLSRTAEEQAAALSRNLAKQIQDWMVENPDWFGDASEMDPATTSPGRPIQPLPPMPGTSGADAKAGSEAAPAAAPKPGTEA